MNYYMKFYKSTEKNKDADQTSWISRLLRAIVFFVCVFIDKHGFLMALFMLLHYMYIFVLEMK